MDEVDDAGFPLFVIEEERPADEVAARGGRVTAEPVNVDVDIAGQKITILQDPMSGCGGNLWHAALFMCHYLSNKERFPPEEMRGKRAIELGAGTGLVGITLLRMGLDCVLTDQPSVLGLLQKNVALNIPGSSAETLQSLVQVLNWGEDCSALSPPLDYIFAADCTYHEAAFEPLLVTLLALSDKHTQILMSFQKRRKADNAFFVKAKKHFTVAEIDRNAVPDIGPRSEEFRKTRVVELRRR